MIQMMDEKGFDYADVPLWYKYGILCKKQLKEFTDEKGKPYTRTKVHNFCANLIKQDKAKVLELFFAKYYEQLVEVMEIDVVNSVLTEIIQPPDSDPSLTAEKRLERLKIWNQMTYTERKNISLGRDDEEKK
jgi:hypothetical protein